MSSQLVRNSAKLNYTLLLVLLTLVAIFVRIYKFGQVPDGVMYDEALTALDAKSLLETGTDHLGHLYPVYMEAWETGHQAALMAYLEIPFIALFGFNIYAIRLPMLLVSLFSLFVLYRLACLCWDDRAALFVYGMAVINPWHIMQSRWSWDCNIYPHVFLFGFYFLCQALKRKKQPSLVIAIVLFAISMYGYGVAWYTVPLFLLFSGLYLLRTRRIKASELCLCIGIFILLVFPLILFVVINMFGLPSIELPFMSMSFFEKTSRTNDILFLSDKPVKAFIDNFKCLFNLLISNSDETWVTGRIPVFDTMYTITLPLVCIGIAVLRKSKDVIGNLLLIWVVAALCCGLFTSEVFSHRINILWYAAIILSGVALSKVSYRSCYIGCYLGLFLAFLFSYHEQLGHSPHKFCGDLSRAITYAESLPNKDIVVASNIPYILTEVSVNFYKQPSFAYDIWTLGNLDDYTLDTQTTYIVQSDYVDFVTFPLEEWDSLYFGEYWVLSPK